MMDTIYYIASILVCFHGECMNFDSKPYAKNIGIVSCTERLEHTFRTQVGPYYDTKIDFAKDRPEDIKIIQASCDRYQQEQIIQ